MPRLKRDHTRGSIAKRGKNFVSHPVHVSWLRILIRSLESHDRLSINRERDPSENDRVCLSFISSSRVWKEGKRKKDEVEQKREAEKERKKKQGNERSDYG